MCLPGAGGSVRWGGCQGTLTAMLRTVHLTLGGRRGACRDFQGGACMCACLVASVVSGSG